jgi:hypothetical protein
MLTAIILPSRRFVINFLEVVVMLQGSINLPVLGRVDKKGMLIGAGVVIALLLLPKISAVPVKLLAQARGMVSKVGGQ